MKYGLIVTPAITRRLVGWCLLYFQPSDIVSRAAFVCIGSVSHAPKQKKAYIYKKTQKSFVTLLPMAEMLAIRGFRGNKIQILTLLPFVTAPVFLNVTI